MKKINKIWIEIEQIVTLLNAEKELLKKIEDAKKRATELLKAGETIPGYVLEESFGNRKWLENATVDNLFEVFKKFIPKKSLYTKTEILSPAQLEKYFIEDAEAMEKLSDFYEKPSKGLQLKRIS